MSTGAIAIFVKTPGLSPVKTRLAVKLGQENAEAFHLASSQAVSAVVQAWSSLENLQSYYAVAEEQALTHKFWQDLPCVWQGEGGLGDRMAHIYHTLLEKHDFVILVGADIPQMTIANFHNSTDWLLNKEQARLVFGPSYDGGFWLIGGNCKIPHAIWTDVIYSQADTDIQFFDKIQQLGEVKTLSVLRDVDEFDDLIPLREALLDLSDSLSAQQELVRFLGTL